MSGTPGLGAFNKDKVANKFGIQLKPKDASQRSSTEKKSTTTTTTSETSNVTKNKTISDFRTNNSTNGFLLNTNRTNSSQTPEPIKKNIGKPVTTKSTSGLVNTPVKTNEKPSTSKSTSGLVNTPVKTNEKPTSLTSNINHSTTKRSSITPTERAVSPAPPTKRPSVSKTESQIKHQKDQPLYRRQLSKPLDNVPPSASTTTKRPSSPNSLKR